MKGNLKKMEIKVRNVSPVLKEELENMCQRYMYPSLNQFMLIQLEAIVKNEGISIYQSHLADELGELKQLQSEFLTSFLKQEFQDIQLIQEIQTLQMITEDWLRFMDEVEAIQAKWTAKGD